MFLYMLISILTYLVNRCCGSYKRIVSLCLSNWKADNLNMILQIHIYLITGDATIAIYIRLCIQLDGISKALI